MRQAPRCLGWLGVGLAWAALGWAACGDDRRASRSDAQTADGLTGVDALGGDTALGGDAVDGPIPVLDPACLDGAYIEALPAVDADVSDLRAAYTPEGYKEFIAGLLEARYPVGAHLVERGVAEGRFGNCVEGFAQGATGNVAQLARRVSTIVHECGHFLDLSRGGFSTSVYVIRPDLSLTCRGGDSRARGGNTFARSEITLDAYDALLPGDFYKDVYLVRSGSEQGFNMLAEEAVQYVNSLATDWALRDFIGAGFSISARDGILTFLWYLQRYLQFARLNDPAAHDFLLGDACWRELILTIWGRAWLYLDETEGIGSLGLRDAALLELVLDPDLVEEIHRVRTAHGCGS